MTIYPLLGQRRQSQVRQALSKWQATRSGRLSPSVERSIVETWTSGGTTKAALARRFGVARTTVYRVLDRSGDRPIMERGIRSCDVDRHRMARRAARRRRQYRHQRSIDHDSRQDDGSGHHRPGIRIARRQRVPQQSTFGPSLPMAHPGQGRYSCRLGHDPLPLAWSSAPSAGARRARTMAAAGQRSHQRRPRRRHSQLPGRALQPGRNYGALERRQEHGLPLYARPAPADPCAETAGTRHVSKLGNRASTVATRSSPARNVQFGPTWEPGMQSCAPHTDPTAFYVASLTALTAPASRPWSAAPTRFARYTGIERHTKDFDIFLHRRDVGDALRALHGAGWRTELTFPHWLGKALCGDDFVDLIFGSGNGVAVVDDLWFAHAAEDHVLGMPARLIPAEEMIWSKSFIMERERYDGADIAHVLRARAPELDWPRLLDRFGENWRVLLSHLVLFGFIYPGERDRVPAWVLRALRPAWSEETGAPPPPGTGLPGHDPVARAVPAGHRCWGYRDARRPPGGTMTNAPRSRAGPRPSRRSDGRADPRPRLPPHRGARRRPLRHRLARGHRRRSSPRSGSGPTSCSSAGTSPTTGSPTRRGSSPGTSRRSKIPVLAVLGNHEYESGKEAEVTSDPRRRRRPGARRRRLRGPGRRLRRAQGVRRRLRRARAPGRGAKGSSSSSSTRR